eukprot:333470-Alexandrium_andersonii.AAC.1
MLDSLPPQSVQRPPVPCWPRPSRAPGPPAPSAGPPAPSAGPPSTVAPWAGLVVVEAVGAGL